MLTFRHRLARSGHRLLNCHHHDFQSAVYDAVASDAVVRPPGPATVLGQAIAAETMITNIIQEHKNEFL